MSLLQLMLIDGDSQDSCLGCRWVDKELVLLLLLVVVQVGLRVGMLGGLR